DQCSAGLRRKAVCGSGCAETAKALPHHSAGCPRDGRLGNRWFISRCCWVCGILGVGPGWGGRMLGQASFSDLEYATKKRRTRRETFLAEMDAVVPWPELLAVVEPHYPRSGGRGRPPVGLASMLRIYFLQQWFALSDRQMEDGLYDIESLRRFAGFSNVAAALPDETTILNFRHLLEPHDLTARLLETVNSLLKAKGLLVSQGTMVDAVLAKAGIIHA